jgi:hypothetical protein
MHGDAKNGCCKCIAFHKEKCMPALLPYKIVTEIHGQLEREIWPHYVYGHEKYICMPICIID